MNNRIRALAASLALTTAFGVGLALQAKFSDIPANHWASGAVSRMVTEGIVTGYPDGTFKGPNAVNRYEVTAMFDRLFSSKRFKALESTSKLAAQVNTDIAALRSASSSNAGSIAALQADIAALKTQLAGGTNTTTNNTTTTTTATDNTELIARLTALEEKVAAISSTDAVSFNDRIGSLEESVKALQAAAPATGTAATPASADLEARLKALETSTATTNADMASKLEAQDTRIAALERQVINLNGSVAALQRALADRPTTPTTTTPTTPTTTTPTTPTTPTTTTPDAPEPDATPVVAAKPALNFGLGGAANILPGGTYSAPLGLGAFAYVGLNLSDSFSIRLNADLSEIPSAGANLILNLGALYAGVGGGVVFANGGFYAGGVLGLNIDFTPNFGLFVEASPRYNFSSSSFGVKTALGLRLGF